MLAALSASRHIDLDPRADEARRNVGDDPRQRHPRNVRINLDVSPAATVMPKGRNFH